MSHLQTYIDPNSTSQLLNNLGLAIDEAKIVMTISTLKNQVYTIESSSGRSSRTEYLRNEIENLESQLNGVRAQANHRMSVFS